MNPLLPPPQLVEQPPPLQESEGQGLLPPRGYAGGQGKSNINFVMSIFYINVGVEPRAEVCCLQGHLAPQSLRCRLSHVNVCFSYCIDDGVLSMTNVPPPSMPGPPPILTGPPPGLTGPPPGLAGPPPGLTGPPSALTGPPPCLPCPPLGLPPGPPPNLSGPPPGLPPGPPGPPPCLVGPPPGLGAPLGPPPSMAGPPPLTLPPGLTLPPPQLLPSLLSLRVDPPEPADSTATPPSEVVLPQALEQVLALKNQLELGTDESIVETEPSSGLEEDIDDSMVSVVGF